MLHDLKALVICALGLVPAACVMTSPEDIPDCDTEDMNLAFTLLTRRAKGETFKLKNIGECKVAYLDIFRIGPSTPVTYCREEDAEKFLCSHFLNIGGRGFVMPIQADAAFANGSQAYLLPGKRALVTIAPFDAAEIGVIVFPRDKPSGWILWFPRDD